MTDSTARQPPLVVCSAAAAVRLEAAQRFVAGFGPAAECLAVGETRAAVDDFAREAAVRSGAVFGLHRFGLRQLAVQLATPELARRGRAPATGLNLEAVAARAAFEEREAGTLGRLGEVAKLRSFAHTLGATLADLRRAGVDASRLAGGPGSQGEIAGLARRYDEQLAQARLVDAAGLLRLAAEAAGRGADALCGIPLLLLDVAVRDDATRALVAALAAHAPAVLATVPAGDRRTQAALEQLPGARLEAPAPPAAGGALDRVRRYLFSPDAPPPDTPDAPPPEAVPPAAPSAATSEVAFFSAPGEGRECVEIARRILQESAQGVRLDRVAILVRAPEAYAGPLETALRRAGLPAWYARGTRLPDPSGRALLALLACAAEQLSARRFSEYLSLAQVPALDPSGAPPAAAADWTPPANAADVLPDPAQAQPAPPEPAESPEPARPAPGSPSAESARPARGAPPDADDRPVVEGSLRAPWKWDRLLVESAVIGGHERWRRRLEGLAREQALRREECAREDPESPRLAAIDRDQRNLRHLMRFALPVIERLAALPEGAPWAVWLEALEALAPRVLARPQRVLAVLAELRPLAEVGPVPLGEVRDVLSERLTELQHDPPPRRYGRVFVGRPELARGRVFDVVFVPGLAERIFPRKQRQDPLLLDAARRTLNADGRAGLPTQDDRARGERLLLQLAVGAAGRRLYLSYPRLDAGESRPRVPSFYALDVERARAGRVPDLDALKRSADDAAGARLAWPAPAEAAEAIDDTEHDLAVLGPLLRDSGRGDAGRARYLLELHPGLRRSLVTRWWRWRQRWSRHDGLCDLQEPESAAALAAHRPGRRPYSVSALQRFAVCPYQFLLSAVLKLQPRAESGPLQRMDPLTRGRMFHEVQAEVVRALGARRALPVTSAGLQGAEALLDETLDAVAARYREELAPAIERVWADEVEALRTDLKGWLQHVADEDGAWTPRFAEFGFGLRAGGGRDPESVAEPVTLGGRWLLRGVVDLIESAGPAPGAPLRVTDHKTGRNRHGEGLVVGRGEVLQPVLYGLAVEQALQRPVKTSRLFFCTLDGMFTAVEAPLGEHERRQGLEVLEIIDRALETGALLPAPREGACRWCDFRPVCGPWEERRAAHKDPAKLADLEALRRMP